MAQRLIREYDAKQMMLKNWNQFFTDSYIGPFKMVQVTPETDLSLLEQEYEWLTNERLTVKADMLMDDHPHLLVDKSWAEVSEWLLKNRDREITVGNVKDTLTHLIIEPRIETERNFYVSIISKDYGDEIHIAESEVDNKGKDAVGNNLTIIEMPVLETISESVIEEKIKNSIDIKYTAKLAQLLQAFYRFYRELHYAFIEVNPLALSKNYLYPVNLKCRIDDVAGFEAWKKWGDITFPKEFGMKMLPEEEYIKEIDEKSGASLKLTVINPKGRIWTMVAGGGASVAYTDTIVDLGFFDELANYGEYSGDPSIDETYEYAKTILDLMTRERNSEGKPKYLLIGGGIANFTDVANTFTGVVKALKEYKQKLIETPVKIYVRRGGPNYQSGLKMMKELEEVLEVPVEVYGPETHMTEIVRMALLEIKSKNQ